MSILKPLLVLEHGFLIGSCLSFLELMVDGLEHQVTCMRVLVSVPVMTRVQELAPSGSPHPVLVGLADLLHEASNGAFGAGVRLLQCKMKSGS